MATAAAPFRPSKAKDTRQLHVNLDAQDRAKLVKLSHARGLSVSDVMRHLIREAKLRTA